MKIIPPISPKKPPDKMFRKSTLSGVLTNANIKFMKDAITTKTKNNLMYSNPLGKLSFIVLG